MLTTGSGAIELGGMVSPSGKTISMAFLEKKAQAILPDRPDLAEEAAQEAAIKLLQITGAEKVLKVESYAAQVVRRAAFDLLREERHRRRTVEISESCESPYLISETNLERCLFAIELLKAIRQGLGRRQYAVAELLYQGYTVVEIARELGVSRVTVYKDIARIRELIERLRPPDPPDNRGGGGVGLPRARGDPTCLATRTEVRRVAAPRRGTTSIKEHQGRGRMICSKSRRPNSAECSAEEMLKELKGLLLQLPAFREVGPALPPESDRKVENLEQVLAVFLHGQRFPKPR